jgi:choline dehydrogenase-like flavoprotein
MPASENALLSALLETIVPRDGFPSAADAGGLRFLTGSVSELQGGSPDRVAAVLALVEAAAGPHDFVELSANERLAVLDGLVNDADYQWFALLVADGYYADEASGGNESSASWKMLHYDPTPPGGWPRPSWSAPTAGRVDPSQLADRYDVIVVGSGAGGGTAACVLAESGRRVLVVERGSWPDASDLWGNHLRNPRTDAGFDSLAGPPSAGNPRVFGGKTDVVVWPSDPRWGNNAMTVGGGTRVYGAQAWRFAPLDFVMASRYGVPEGSALADWPISYDDLEPFYARAERELGVSGAASTDRWAGRRSSDYPMPPLALNVATEVLARGASALGLTTAPVPLLINSEPYGDRPACARCGACVGFACPIEAKTGSHNTVLARALATGRCDLLLETRAERLLTDSVGRVVGVSLVGSLDSSIWRREVFAAEVALGAGATETARILLASGNDGEPDGLGNRADQVGRHLQAHVYAGAVGIFDDLVADGLGPGPTISTCDFRHGNAGVVGGGMLANEFVATPVDVLHYLTSAGLIPRHGPEAKRGMRDFYPRMQRIVGPIQEMTLADSRVRLDWSVRDAFGIPVARLSGGVHPEDLKAQQLLSAVAEDWLSASGAREIRRWAPRELDGGPSTGQHQAGTARMGTDPAKSVTDPMGRVWGHDNLRVVDGSLHVTNGGVNPVLTIFANAFRIAEDMAR